MDILILCGLCLLVYCLFNRQKIDNKPGLKKALKIFIYGVSIGLPLVFVFILVF